MLMNKYFYTFLIAIIFSFFSCIKEYQVFYPYKNTGLSYLNQLQPRAKVLKFHNDSLFTYTSESGLTVNIKENSFEDVNGMISLHIENPDSQGDYIADRISFENQNKTLISGYNVISFYFTDDLGNHPILKKDALIEFKIPFGEIKIPAIYKFFNDKWTEEFISNENFKKTTWEVITGEEPILQKGYIFKTKEEGKYCLGTPIERQANVENLSVSLPKGFDVNNSIVQINYSDLNTNIEMFWDGENKTFQLPTGLKIPDNEASIIILSENAESQPFFGMKSVFIQQGESISIDVNKKTIDDIKNILNEL